MSVYKVFEKNAAGEVVNARIIVADLPTQAVRYASANRFEAHALTANEVAEAVGAGYKIEIANAPAPAIPPPPGSAS